MMREPVYRVIGSIIRGHRRRLEWPQQLLAARLGISRATLANIETGRQRVLVHQLYAFAEALKLNPSDLLPPLGDDQPAADVSVLRIHGDVSPEQREQIARLIGPQPSSPKAEETTNAKIAKRNPRKPRE